MADLNFNSLKKSALVKVFTDAGGINITDKELDHAIADGAPVNDDGTLNALHIIAWLVGEKYG